MGKALEKGIAEIECINPRDFAGNSYGCIDKRLLEEGLHDYDGRAAEKSIIAISKKHLKSDLVVINFSPCGQKLTRP